MCTSSQALRTTGLAQDDHGVAHGGNQGHDEDDGEDEDAEAFGFISPIDAQEQHGDEEGAHGERLVEIGDGAVVREHSLVDDRDAMQDGADRKRGEGNAEEVLAFADQRKDGVQQADRVQSRGHAQPDNTHFSHGVRRVKEY